MPTYDSDVVIDVVDSCVDIEEEKARMLSENLTEEAKSHILKAFAERRENPEKALKNSRIVTNQKGEDLVRELKELAITKGLLQPEDFTPNGP